MRDDEDDKQDIGPGSVRWFEKLRQDHTTAAAIGGFFGQIVGKLMEPGPQFRITADGHLMVRAGHGLAVTIEQRYLTRLYEILQNRGPRWHLWMRDDDLAVQD